jgi:hypothetical protein
MLVAVSNDPNDTFPSNVSAPDNVIMRLPASSDTSFGPTAIAVTTRGRETEPPARRRRSDAVTWRTPQLPTGCAAPSWRPPANERPLTLGRREAPLEMRDVAIAKFEFVFAPLGLLEIAARGQARAPSVRGSVWETELVVGWSIIVAISCSLWLCGRRVRKELWFSCQRGQIFSSRFFIFVISRKNDTGAVRCAERRR